MTSANEVRHDAAMSGFLYYHLDFRSDAGSDTSSASSFIHYIMYCRGLDSGLVVRIHTVLGV